MEKGDGCDGLPLPLCYILRSGKVKYKYIVYRGLAVTAVTRYTEVTEVLESRIENSMLKLVQERGGLWIKLGHSGWPDRILIAPTEEGKARVVFIELKQETGRASKRQQARLRQLWRAGADARLTPDAASVRAVIEEVLPDAVSAP